MMPYMTIILTAEFAYEEFPFLNDIARNHIQIGYAEEILVMICT
jgi:hypothetical protein